MPVLFVKLVLFYLVLRFSIFVLEFYRLEFRRY